MLNGWIISNLWDNFEPSDGCKKPGHVAGYVGQNNKYFSIDHRISEKNWSETFKF